MKRSAMSLVEIVIVMSITAVLGLIVAQMVNTTFRENRRLEAASVSQRDAAIAIERIGRVLRSTIILMEATGNAVTIRGYPTTRDTVPSQIRYYLEGSAIRLQLIPPSGTAPNFVYNPAHAEVFTILPRVQLQPNQTIFRYLGEQNQVLTFPVSVADVRAIEITLPVVDRDGFKTDPTVVSTIISLRNFKTNL